MKFFKNKFFIISLLFIFLAFIFQFFYISKSYKVDTNSYVTLVKGNWILTSNEEKKVLKIDQREWLKIWDVVATIWDGSLAIIEWWDKSITRLAWNSKILIKENYISDDLGKINISFELLKWKTWSNVITIMWENSYFKQDVKWVTASVRWTIFETSYDNDYLYVQDHQVKVSNTSWQEKTIQAGEWFIFSSFTLDKLLELRDKAWEKLNAEMDIEYYKNLREELIKKYESNSIINFFKNIFSSENKALSLALDWKYDELNEYVWTLSSEEKEKVLSKLNTLMQDTNFEKWENQSVYDLKVSLKNILISNTEDVNYKETLLKYTIYDLNDMFNYENINKKLLESTMNLLEKNKSFIDFNSDNFKMSWENIELIKQFLSSGNFNPLFDKVKWKLFEIDAAWKKIVNDSLNKAFEFLTK